MTEEELEEQHRAAVERDIAAEQAWRVSRFEIASLIETAATWDDVKEILRRLNEREPEMRP